MKRPATTAADVCSITVRPLEGVLRIDVQGHGLVHLYIDMPGTSPERESAGWIRQINSSLLDFVDKRCAIDARAREYTYALYDAFVAWCGEQGLAAGSLARFGRDLRQMGFGTIKDRHGRRQRVGLQLRATEGGAFAQRCEGPPEAARDFGGHGESPDLLDTD